MNDRRRIIDDRLYAHFVTFSVFRRRRLLDHDHLKRILLGMLNAESPEHAARCIGFVIMPDHVHAILWFPTTGRLSRFMHGWERKSSFHIRAWYRRELDSRQHPSAECFRGLRAGRAAMAALPARNTLTTETPMLRLIPVGNQITYPFPCR